MGELILVVDDDPSIRHLLRLALHAEDYEVAEARDGAEALTQVAEDVPALILLDLNMPHMDGATLLGELRRQRLCVGTPVIVLTAASTESPDTASLLDSLGVQDCFPKPFDLDELLVRVARQIRGSPVYAAVGPDKDWVDGPSG
jgi:DNA-binding response OmpR family regulator